MTSKRNGRPERSGRQFERNVEALMIENGVTFDRKPRIKGASFFGEGEDIIPDFLVKADPAFYLECKWQSANGSAYQKIPYQVASIKERYDKPGVLLLGGPELRRVLPWARAQVDGVQLIGVWTEAELMQWLMRRAA